MVLEDVFALEVGDGADHDGADHDGELVFQGRSRRVLVLV